LLLFNRCIFLFFSVFLLLLFSIHVSISLLATMSNELMLMYQFNKQISLMMDALCVVFSFYSLTPFNEILR